MSSLKIGTYRVGSGFSPFIIAEAGINHNGDLQKAKMLVDEAVKAGAHAIKFQTHFPEFEMLRDEQGADYIGESFYDLLDRTKLSQDEHVLLKKYSEERNILFLSTPFSREAADFLEDIGVAAFKIGSGELTNIPFLEHVARKNKPMIISTGMSTLNEIKESIDVVKAINNEIILLQCTSAYPTHYNDVNLRFLQTLREHFDVCVGLSDHSEGIYTVLGAVSLGACVLEKHFTMSRDWPGPDQKSSIEPYELKMIVEGVQAIFLALGNGEKVVLDQEKPVQDMARESVVTIKDIKPGERLDQDNLWVKRPGTGIPAKFLKDLFGKKAINGVAKDSLLSTTDFE